MRKLYRYVGLKKPRSNRSSSREKISRGFNDDNEKNRSRGSSKKFNLKDFGIGLLSSINRMQFNYSESNSSFLPGYLPTPGFVGTIKPTIGYTMGSQRAVSYTHLRAHET